MQQRVLAINPACRVTPVERFIEADNLSEVVEGGFDYVLDCIDSFRTKAALIYQRTGNLRAVQLLLGHTKVDSTVRYLGIELEDGLSIAERIDI